MNTPIAVSKEQEPEPRIWWHWQNLTQDDDHLNRKRFPWNGRAWLHLGLRRCASIEWSCDKRFRAGVGFSAGADRGWQLHIGLWPLNLYFGFEGFGLPVPSDWREKECSISCWGFDEGDPAIHWSIWADTMEWRSKDPWWAKTHVFNLKDFFLGRWEYSEEKLKVVPVKIPMEEATYDGVATLEHRTWKRPRWPWPHMRLSWNLDIPKGIPFPGKGTAAYNCGDDALHGIGATSRNGNDVEVVIARAVEAVLEKRRRYPL